jgi:hypothetical protein
MCHQVGPIGYISMMWTSHQPVQSTVGVPIDRLFQLVVIVFESDLYVPTNTFMCIEW